MQQLFERFVKVSLPFFGARSAQSETHGGANKTQILKISLPSDPAKRDAVAKPAIVDNIDHANNSELNNRIASCRQVLSSVFISGQGKDDLEKIASYVSEHPEWWDDQVFTLIAKTGNQNLSTWLSLNWPTKCAETVEATLKKFLALIDDSYLSPVTWRVRVDLDPF